ncbi:4Fe-4S single cluster domain-containing protein [Laspinema olomoucense]|uniref:4Fe-4S single cluster domain-containing protein n=1 Tax=Laspinema olomoucense TaxID=3231600 RepID=UPI0021BB3B30|nr:4Fe-4S single cluster domain-containing protein [Laspinema sp. D3d]MCT7973423.1 radical SAM protein [Laspinema sp. D3d]
MTTTLQIFRRQSPVEVLGPGQRAVLWVQGCPFACPGCIVPESWDARGGETVTIEELAHWILAQPNIEGITLSGGEPMMQANALSQLIDTLHQQRDLGVMCYTGYRLETLQQQGSDAQRQLLQRIDLLVDGQYRQEEHDNLLWRGSRNQRLWLLTSRDRAAVAQQLAQGDSSAGLSFVSATTGEVFFTGVPPSAGFRQQFESQMQQRGIRIRV